MTNYTIDFLKEKLRKDTRLSLDWGLSDAEKAYEEVRNKCQDTGDWYDWLLQFLRAEIKRLGGKINGKSLKTPEEMRMFD